MDALPIYLGTTYTYQFLKQLFLLSPSTRRLSTMHYMTWDAEALAKKNEEDFTFYDCVDLLKQKYDFALRVGRKE